MANRKEQRLTLNDFAVKPFKFDLAALLNWYKECLFRMKSKIDLQSKNDIKDGEK